MSLLGAAAIGAGASILGNMFGAHSQKKANDTNMAIAQMNNMWSEKMMQKQMDYNTEMWNKQNEYNDPSKQVERLTKAGINPALALSNISTGSASAASSPSLPSPSGTSVQAFRPDFSGIGNSLMTAYQLEGVRKQQDAQSRFLDTQSAWYGAKAMSDIAEAFSRTRNNELKNKFQEVQNSWADSMLGVEYINKIRQNQSMEVSILNSIKQGMLLDNEISSYDARLNGQLSEQLSRTMLNYAQGDLTKQQVKTEIEKTAGQKLSNKEKDAIFDYVVEKAKLDTIPDGGRGLPKAAWWIGNQIDNFFGK